MKENKVSIVLLDAFPVPCVKGGAIETLMDSFLRINEEERKVMVDFFCVYDEEAEKLSAEFSYNNFNYIKINKFVELIYKAVKKVLKLFIPLPYKYYYYKVFRKIKKLKSDMIIFEGGPINGSGLSAFSQLAPLCYHLHIHGVPEQPVKLYNSLIGVSNYVAEKWAEISPEQKICVAYNGIDVDRFINCNSDKSKLRKKLNLNDDDFVIIYVGRIIEVKGIYELICSLEGMDDNIKLVVIGSSNFAEKTCTEYEKMVEQKINNLGDKVVFTGYVPNEKLQDYYHMADIQVIPSKWEEAAGLVAIEGMASGLPIVATKSGGMVEYVDSSCAYLIEKDNNLENNIRKAVNYLYNNPELRKQMSDSGKERAKLFSKKEFYNSMIKAIYELI